MPGADEVVYVCLERCLENEVERVEFSVTSSARLSHAFPLTGYEAAGTGHDLQVVVVNTSRR